MENQGNIHSTGLVLSRMGLLLRGPSGAGKSLMALELLDNAELRGEKAVLVSDDRIDLSVARGKLYMHAPPTIGGMIELRGRGIVRRPYTEKAQVHLVVDVVDRLTRLVEEDELLTEIEGVTLPRCPVPNRSVTDSTHQQLLVREAIRAVKARAGSARRQKSA